MEGMAYFQLSKAPDGPLWVEGKDAWQSKMSNSSSEACTQDAVCFWVQMLSKRYWLT
jgi:hypothetical protein